MDKNLDPMSEKFTSLLKVFNKTIDGFPEVPKVKKKLEDLKELSKNSPELNYRQMEAIIARCDNYIKGEYGKTKTEANLTYGKPLNGSKL